MRVRIASTLLLLGLGAVVLLLHPVAQAAPSLRRDAQRVGTAGDAPGAWGF